MVMKNCYSPPFDFAFATLALHRSRQFGAVDRHENRRITAQLAGVGQFSCYYQFEQLNLKLFGILFHIILIKEFAFQLKLMRT